MAPLSLTLVKLQNPQEYVRAGRHEDLQCVVTGSRPDPIVTWWRDGRKLVTQETQVFVEYIYCNLIKKQNASNYTHNGVIK